MAASGDTTELAETTILSPSTAAAVAGTQTTTTTTNTGSEEIKTERYISYEQWLKRFHRTRIVLKYLNLDHTDKQCYQLYLLDFGQFNANYVLDELLTLQYPLSPFIPTKRHSYIRATDTWAMEMLSLKYRKYHKQDDLYPVWLGSEEFWTEFKRYAQPVTTSGMQDFISKTVSQNQGCLHKPIWIEVEQENFSKYETLRKEFKGKLKEALFKNLFEVKIDPSLKELFRAVWEKNNLQIYENDSILCLLEHQFPEVTTKQLSSYTEQIHSILEKDVEDYSSKCLSKTAFYYKHSCSSSQEFPVEALVLVSKPSHYSIMSVINNMGYRADPIRLARIVLQHYPDLFIEEQCTQKFFEHFRQTKIRSEEEGEGELFEFIEKEVLKTIKTGNSTPIIEACSSLSENVKKNLHCLEEFQGGFNVYCKFMLRYLKKYAESAISNEKGLLFVALPEVVDALHLFIKACRKNNLASAVRQVQVVAEVMLLHFEFEQLGTLYPVFVQQKLGHNVQRVSLTPYAMTAFVRVFQIARPECECAQPLKIAATSQSYFELLQNLERLDEQTIVYTPIQHCSQIDEYQDVIFIEIHPNNVMATKQFAHDVKGLIEKTFPKKKKKRTLVIDITLNMLGDKEIIEILKSAQSLLDGGDLNVILIQSLTKFCQLGLDKRSAGLVVMINNGAEPWKAQNDKLKQLDQSEQVYHTTVRFFSYFCSADVCESLTDYVKLINQNTRWVYNEIMRQFDKLEVMDTRKFQITLNSDPKSCYVALNVNIFSLNPSDVESFLGYLLKYLICPLCKSFSLPLTKRMSIGFPLSSVNAVYNSLRITIGLEERSKLEHYVDILAYVAFVLNGNLVLKYFSDDDFWENFLSQKEKQFKAVEGDKFCVKGVGDIECERIAEINEGHVEIKIQGEKEPYKLIVEIRGVKNSFEQLSLPVRRMVFASLFKWNEDKKQVSDFSLDNSTHAHNATFVLGVPSSYCECGPIRSENDRQKMVSFRICRANISADESVHLFVKQGNIVIPLLDMPREDRKWLFDYGQQPSVSYQPAERETKVYIKYSEIIIERDFILTEGKGVTVYHRSSGGRHYFEVDFWSIKNPFFARFMQFLTVFVVCIKKGIEDFIVHDDRLRCFCLSVNDAASVFCGVIENILKNKHFLIEILEFGQKSLDQFFPSRYTQDYPVSVNSFENPLISKARKLLNIDL